MRRALTIIALGVVVAVVTLLGIDTGFGVAAERSLARSLGSGDDELRYEPEVTISGFPATRSISDGHYSSIGITARAVRVVGAGNCTDDSPCHADLRSRLHDVQIRGPERAFRSTSVLDVASVSGSVTVDSVTIGRLIGIDDLTVNTPAPRGKVGGGGPQDGLLSRTTGVLMTGSVSPGRNRPRTKVSVTVDLSVADGRMRLHATGFYDGPEEHAHTEVAPSDRAAILAAFSSTLPHLPTPWGQPVKSVRSSGSDLMLETVGGLHVGLTVAAFAVLIR